MPNILLLSRIFWSSLILCFPLQTGRGLHSLLFAQHRAECMPQSVCPFPQSHCLAHWIILITRYHAENRNITLGEYKFGPLFMRLCYELDLEDSAVELIKDQVTVSPVAFPATVISLCWGGRVFSDVRKGSSSIHIIPGLDFHREATRLSERALPCVFKVSLESLPTERGRFLCIRGENRRGRGAGTDCKVSTHLGCTSTGGRHPLLGGVLSGDSLRRPPFPFFICASLLLLYFYFWLKAMLTDGFLFSEFLLSHNLIFFS